MTTGDHNEILTYHPPGNLDALNPIRLRDCTRILDGLFWRMKILVAFIREGPSIEGPFLLRELGDCPGDLGSWSHVFFGDLDPMSDVLVSLVYLLVGGFREQN